MAESQCTLIKPSTDEVKSSRAHLHGLMKTYTDVIKKEDTPSSETITCLRHLTASFLRLIADQHALEIGQERYERNTLAMKLPT